MPLDLDPNRAPTTPKPAATVLVLRDGPKAVEIFCIVRHPKSGFLGGVVAFPGGKVDAADGDDAWDARTTKVNDRLASLAELPVPARALAIAACREALEEAAILPTTGGELTAESAREIRAKCEGGAKLFDELTERDLTLDLAALIPFARWVTPTAEARRFDATFFLLALPAGQQGDFDGHETTSGFWTTAAEALARWSRDELSMAPPTTRCLELLANAKSVTEAIAIAHAQTLLPICPRLVPGPTSPVLALPGDKDHEIAERRVDGPTRFVLEGVRFVGRDAD